MRPHQAFSVYGIALLLIIAGGIGVVLLLHGDKTHQVQAGDRPDQATLAANRDDLGSIRSMTGNITGVITARDGASTVLHVGSAVHAGDELRSSGTDGEISVAIGVRIAIHLEGEATVAILPPAADPAPLTLSLSRGRITVACSEGSLAISTAGARTDIRTGTAAITATADGTQVEVTKGEIRLGRADGGHALTIGAGQQGSLNPGSDPTLTTITHFAMGINLGGDTVVINRKRWLSHRQALIAGLTLAPGTVTMPPLSVNSRGLDFDTKAMIECGVGSADGPIHISQRIPSGEYLVSVYLTSAHQIDVAALSIVLGGHAVSIGVPHERAEQWLHAGPYAVQAVNGTLDVLVDGGGPLRLAGIEIRTSADIQLPLSLALSSPADDQYSYARQPTTLNTDVFGDGDLITRIQYLDGDTIAGEATRFPFTFTYAPAIGVHTYRAVAVDAFGHTSRSAAVIHTVLPAGGTGSVLRECWLGIMGAAIPDAAGLAGFPGRPASSTFLPTLEAAKRIAINYGERVRGWLIPPLDGPYIFAISAADSGQLFLSTDEQVGSKRLIARCDAKVPLHEWGQHSGQHSDPIVLAAGKRYYIEVLHKVAESDGTVSVGWTLPNGKFEAPIAAANLSPYIPAADHPDISSTAKLGSGSAAPNPLGALDSPRFLKGINLGGEAVTIDGHHWLSQHDAEVQGLSLKHARTITASIEPNPPVDADTRSMLDSGIAAAGGKLTISQNCANGRYQVFAWIMEATHSDSHVFTLTANGESIAGVGSLQLGDWLRYGPITTTVSDTSLQVTCEPQKGNPQLMGIAIFALP